MAAKAAAAASAAAAAATAIAAAAAAEAAAAAAAVVATGLQRRPSRLEGVLLQHKPITPKKASLCIAPHTKCKKQHCTKQASILNPFLTPSCKQK